MGVAKVSEYKPGDRILNLCTLSFSSFCQSKGQKGVLPPMLVNVGPIQYRFAMRRRETGRIHPCQQLDAVPIGLLRDRVGNGSGTEMSRSLNENGSFFAKFNPLSNLGCLWCPSKCHERGRTQSRPKVSRWYVNFVSRVVNEYSNIWIFE